MLCYYTTVLTRNALRIHQHIRNRTRATSLQPPNPWPWHTAIPAVNSLTGSPAKFTAHAVSHANGSPRLPTLFLIWGTLPWSIVHFLPTIGATLRRLTIPPGPTHRKNHAAESHRHAIAFVQGTPPHTKTLARLVQENVRHSEVHHSRQVGQHPPLCLPVLEHHKYLDRLLSLLDE